MFNRKAKTESAPLKIEEPGLSEETIRSLRWAAHMIVKDHWTGGSEDAVFWRLVATTAQHLADQKDYFERLPPL